MSVVFFSSAAARALAPSTPMQLSDCAASAPKLFLLTPSSATTHDAEPSAPPPASRPSNCHPWPTRAVTAPSRTMRSVLPSRPISPHILATSAIAATADADEAGRVRGCSTQSVLHDCCTRHDCRCPDSYHINRNL